MKNDNTWGKSIIKLLKKNFQLIIVICILVLVVLLNWLFLFNNKPKALEKEIPKFTNNLQDVERYNEINPEKEIMERMLGENWVSIAKENVEVTNTYFYEVGSEVDITITTYDYGRVYEKAKKDADKYIKKNPHLSKKEKNDLLTDNLREQLDSVLYKETKVSNKVKKMFYIGRNGRSLYYEMEKLEEQSDNYDLYNALLGGIINAYNKNPCDYLIIRDEYKYYEELTKMIRDWEKDCKEAIAKGNIKEDDMKAREVLSAFYVESTGDMGKDIEYELRDVSFSITNIDRKRQKIDLIFDSKDYG